MGYAAAFIFTCTIYGGKYSKCYIVANTSSFDAPLIFSSWYAGSGASECSSRL
jgi:hypothetical protein